MFQEVLSTHSFLCLVNFIHNRFSPSVLFLNHIVKILLFFNSEKRLFSSIFFDKLQKLFLFFFFFLFLNFLLFTALEISFF